MKVAYSATHTLTSVIRHHREQPRSVGFDADGAERWQAILQKLDELVRPVAAEVEAIFTDPKLTDEGKQTKVLTIGPRVVSNFSNLGVVLNQADQAKARFEKILFDPITQAPDGNAVVQYLREAEIRRLTGKREANINFLKAVDANDLETARALLNAPGQPWVSAEAQKRGREAYAEKTNPVVWEKLEYVDVLREHLSALSQAIATWLGRIGASPESIQQATKANKD